MLVRPVAALVAFAVLSVLVAIGALRQIDRTVLDAIQTPHEYWLDLAGSLVSVFGKSEIIFSILLGVAVARLRHGRADWWPPLLVAVVVAIEVVLKFVVPQRPPPEELSRSLEFGPFLRPPTPFAFPSGHMARVTFLVAALPVPAGFAWTTVAIFALTRVYLAEHWPADVMGGVLLGYGIAALSPRAPRAARAKPPVKELP